MSRERLVRSALAALVAASVAASVAAEDPPGKKGPPLPAGALGRVPAARAHALFSPDGKYFLAISNSEIHTYCLWDAATHKLVRKFVGPKKPGPLFGTHIGFSAAAFSADGKVLATASLDELRVWEVDTGKEVRSWPGHQFGADSVALTADGKVLVSRSTSRVGRDLFVRVWDAQTGKRRHEFPCGQNWQAACLSPSGKQVAVLNGEAHTVTVYDLDSGKQVRQFPTVRDSNQGRLDYHPDGKSLFVTSMGDRGGIRRYDAESGKDLGLTVSQAEIRGVAFSKDFAVAATITPKDGVVRFWDLTTGKAKGTVTPGDKSLWAVALSPDGKVLATQAEEQEPSFVFWKAPD